MFKFYCYDALMKMNSEKALKERFAMSDVSYNQIIKDASNVDWLFVVLTKRNMFDVIHLEDDNNEIEDYDIACAVQYDNMLHPDEVVFVTTDKDLAKRANMFFGEDMIKLMK